MSEGGLRTAIKITLIFCDTPDDITYEMKLLVVCVNITESEKKIFEPLGNLGVEVHFVAHSEEAEIFLEFYHESIGIIVGKDGAGANFVEHLRQDPEYKEKAFILWTSQWSGEKCANHASSKYFANAYLTNPLETPSLFDAIDSVIGSSFAKGVALEAGSTEQKNSSKTSNLNPSAAPLSPAIPVIQRSELTSGGTKRTVAPLTVESAPEHESATGGTIALSDFSDGLELDLQGGGPAASTQSASENSKSQNVEAPEVEVAVLSPESAPIPPTDSDSLMEFQLEKLKKPQGLEKTAPLSTTLTEDQTKTGQTRTGVTGEHEFTQIRKIPEIPEIMRGQDLKIPEDLSPQDDEEPLYLKRGDYTKRLQFSLPSDGVIVPGGASQAPDEETLKKYLLLREQDVAVLSQQLRQAKDQVQRLESQVKQANALQSEYQHVAKEQNQRIENFEREKAQALELSKRENFELQFDLKKRVEEVRSLEIKHREASKEIDRIKERIRADIRKIRVREKELENKLEILKRDTDALLSTRETRIIELKRRMDILEFNNDLLHDQLSKEKEHSRELKDKLERASQMVKLAKGLLEPSTQDAIAEDDALEENLPQGEEGFTKFGSIA